MGIFDRFPYSSTHEMNLDFMLGKATEIAEDMQQVTAGMEQVQAGLEAISEKTEQATQAAAQAAASASSIEGSVTAAEEAAEEAQMHNESAQTWANNALTYKADCQRAATEAAASSSSAAQAATAAAASEDTVATYAQAANASAQSAANNNDSAHQYANQASASASNATFHSSNAQTAATNAQTAATNANTSATNASTSADRAASLKTDVETLHRMCTAAVDQAATEAVNAANSAAQAAATKTDVETLVESLPEDFTDLNNTVNQLSDEINTLTEEKTEAVYTDVVAVSNSTTQKFYYNTQYNRIALSNDSTMNCKVYQVTPGKYSIKGYGSNAENGAFAAVGNADIISSGAGYCTLLELIDSGAASGNVWRTVEVEISNSGYLYVNYSPITGDQTSTVKKITEDVYSVIKTDDTLSDPDLPANAYATGEAIKNATKAHGIIKTGNSYMHYSHAYGNTYILRTIAPHGPNNLYDYKQLAIGHFVDGEMIVDATVWNAFTDQIGPVSMRLSGTGENYGWTGGMHAKTIDGTDYPTAETHDIKVYVDGVDITNSANGNYEGDCRIIATNYLYAPQTITGADLSSATLAIVETRTFILTDTLKVQVLLTVKENIDIALYYGMQAQDNHTSRILLPTACLDLAPANMSTGLISQSKEWSIMLSDNNGWHYDMLLANVGLGTWEKNDGTSAHGRLSHYSKTKIYYVLCVDQTVNENGILFWEGEYRTYHD